MYEGLKMPDDTFATKYVLWFFVWFYIRRLLFAVSVVVIGDYPAF